MTKISLPIKSWQILKDAIGSPGWAITYKHIHIAGKMDEENTIAVTDNGNESELVDKELTDNQVEACKLCLEFNLKRGGFFANRYSAKLLAVFLQET